MAGYRTNESYQSQDPERRKRQQSGLKKRWVEKPLDSDHAGKVSVKDSIIAFAEHHFCLPETRKPIVLLDWEKDIFRSLFEADPKPTLALLGMCKKSGKSTIAAIIALWMLLTKPFAEIYIMGPDIQQGQLVVFDKIRKAIRMHRQLFSMCKTKKDRIECKSSEGFIQVLPCNKTSAGLSPDLVVFDELWQFDTEEAKRAIDEMTNIPGKENLLLVVSYAGFADSEDTHLWRWYKQGIDQAEGREEKDERFFFLWRTDYKDIPWVSKQYLTSQKRRLRENTYLRLHENRWVSSEEAFVNAEILDACTHESYQRGLPAEGRVVAAIDCGPKWDASAIVLVKAIDSENLAVVDHAIFEGRGKVLDLEKTIEAMMLFYDKQYDILTTYFDPYQMVRSARTLEKKGLRMAEYCQTVQNMVRASETLSGLLHNGTLMLYPDADLRQHVLNAKVKEHTLGWRLIKDRASKKIDLAIALAMAVQAATENFLLKRPAGVSIPDWDNDDDLDDAMWTPGILIG